MGGSSYRMPGEHNARRALVEMDYRALIFSTRPSGQSFENFEFW